MTASDVRIVPYEAAMRERLLDLSIRAWDSVFEAMRDDLDRGFVPRFVYDNFYPDGWDVRQRVDLALVLDEEAGNCDVALVDDEIAGWVCTRIHPEDSMGEVYILCVDPAHQREGIGRALMEHAHERARRVGIGWSWSRPAETWAMPRRAPPTRRWATSAGPSPGTSSSCDPLIRGGPGRPLLPHHRER